MLQQISATVKVLLLACLSVAFIRVKAQTLIFPDCTNGNNIPSCTSGGIVVNVGSANPVAARTPGWGFVASPLSDNVAWQLYSNDTKTVIGNANCAGFTYGNLATAGQGGNLWAVITLATNTNIAQQPLLGIFAADSTCPFIYSLPSAIVGGPIYIYTTVDDGSHPEISTRAKLTQAEFACNAPLSTPVSYILFGTMQVSVGNFVLQYAGWNTAQPGCAASYTFILPAATASVGTAIIPTTNSNVGTVAVVGTPTTATTTSVGTVAVVPTTATTTTVTVVNTPTIMPHRRLMSVDPSESNDESESTGESADYIAAGIISKDASLITEKSSELSSEKVGTHPAHLELPFGPPPASTVTQMPVHDTTTMKKEGPLTKIKRRFLRR